MGDERCENCNMTIKWWHRNSRDRGRWVHIIDDKEECDMVLYAHPTSTSQDNASYLGSND